MTSLIINLEMSTYSCSKCEYKSLIRSNVTKHIKNKTKCYGADLIIDIVKVECEFCSKDFENQKYLDQHKKQCNKKTKFSDNLDLKKQVDYQEKQINNLSVQTDDQAEQIAKLTNLVSKLLEKNKDSDIKPIKTKINNYPDTDYTFISDTEFNQIIKNNEDQLTGLIADFIKKIHFNSNKPENHNIVIRSRVKGNKDIHIRQNNQWEVKNRNFEINNLISDIEMRIDDWLKLNEKKTLKSKERYQNYLDAKENTEELKQIKEQVELTLFNNRGMVEFD